MERDVTVCQRGPYRSVAVNLTTQMFTLLLTINNYVAPSLVHKQARIVKLNNKIKDAMPVSVGQTCLHLTF